MALELTQHIRRQRDLFTSNINTNKRKISPRELYSNVRSKHRAKLYEGRKNNSRVEAKLVHTIGSRAVNQLDVVSANGVHIHCFRKCERQ